MSTAIVTSAVAQSLPLRRAIRAAAQADARLPIVVVPGDAAPAEKGRSYHWTTRTGIEVRHPSAYARVGWSSLCYHASTRRVVVGAEWLWGQA